MKYSDIRCRRQGDTPFFPNMLNNSGIEVMLKSDVDSYIQCLTKSICNCRLVFSIVTFFLGVIFGYFSII